LILNLIGFCNEGNATEWGEITDILCVRTWLVVLIVSVWAVASTYFWLHNRQSPAAGLCRFCGYDLRATPERCPECGNRPLKSCAPAPPAPLMAAARR
jgi:hypothetical protein